MINANNINDFNFSSFLEAVKAFLSNAFPNYGIEETTATKNNGVHLTGISVKPQRSQVAPTVYLNSYFAEYQEGKPLSDILDKITQAYKKALEGKSMRINPNVLNDFDAIKDKICYALVNRKLNTSLLANVPYRDWYSLAITYYVLCDIAEDGMGTITVTNDLMQLWGADEQQLYELACHNTPILHHGRVVPLMDEISRCSTGGMQIPESADGREQLAYKDYDITINHNNSDGDIGVYYASTVNQAKGSCVILYPGLLETMARQIGSFYALPSAIHEFLLVPGEFGDEEILSQLVKSVNDTQVPEDEILSGSCFFYDAAKHELNYHRLKPVGLVD